jgi:hypothetical protein
MRQLSWFLVLGGTCGLVSCTGGESTPTGAVNAFLAAGKSGDKKAFMNCLQASDRAFMEKMEGFGAAGGDFKAPEGTTFTVGEAKISGDTATVVVTTNEKGNVTTQELKLVKEGGAWKIDILPDEMHKMAEGLKEAMEAGMKETTDSVKDAVDEAESK